jgi:hypothetical protein
LSVFVSFSAAAIEPEYWAGVQDFAVPDVDSHTYGISARAAIDGRTKAGQHLVGSLDIFFDHDKDHLDNDHIPIRWDVHLGVDQELWQAARMHIGWTADVNTRMNTVSSIEREIAAFPAIAAWYDGSYFRAGVKAGAGWFLLEIDDDAPNLRGYNRDDLRNSTLGYTVAADASIRLGSCCKLFGLAQEWRDNNEWLQTQYEASFDVGTGKWVKDSAIELNAVFYHYNLDVYQRSDIPQAVLGWDNDVLIRLSFKTKW